MAACEMIAKCIFFNDKMANMPAMASMMKKKYCQGDNTRCARYVVCKAKGREAVPGDLTPAQMERAQAIIG